MGVQVNKIVKSTVVEDVPDGDLITVSVAAELAGYSFSGIVRLIERGALPEYRLLQPPNDDRVFTSKAAVEALPPKPTRKVAKKRKGAK